MSSENITDHEIILQRLLIETGHKTKSSLAKELGYNSVSGVSNWKERGVDWNKIISKYPSLDVKYVNTGEREKPPEESISDSLDLIKDRVEEQGIDYTDRAELAAVVQDRAKNLSRDLKVFSQMIGRLRKYGDSDSS